MAVDAWPRRAPPQRKGIRDVFYETRVMMGREYTVRRFAIEVLGNSVSPLLLGYIEKGKRMPNEGLVRRLAAVRKQDPQELLALLWRDRMLHAFGRELRRVLRAPRGMDGIEDADLAVLVSQAIAALPEDGSWIPWRAGAARSAPCRARRTSTPARRRVGHAGRGGAASNAPARRGARRQGAPPRPPLRRRRPRTSAARWRSSSARSSSRACSTSWPWRTSRPAPTCATTTSTSIRRELPEIQKRLDAAVAQIADEFARGPSPQRRFLNMLITSTPFCSGGASCTGREV